MRTANATQVPLFDMNLQNKGLHKLIEAAVWKVIHSGHFVLGSEIEALEKEVADYCGAAAAIACNSGTDALLLALMTLDIGPGDEVILPTFTFFATAGSVCRLGARPVFVDIDADSYHLDPHQVENKITERTKAIIPVHLFGQCADMEPLWQIGARHGVPIIEDAAQSLGAEYQNKRAGTLGAMACLSFYPTKNLGAFGDAGMVVTNDQEWAAKLACLRVHGMQSRYYHKYVGINSRLDALQAAVLRVKLPWLDRFIDARRGIAGRYDTLIDEKHLGHFLQKPGVKPNCRHTFNQYVVRVADGQRDALRRHLHSDGVGTEIYYPLPLHLQEAFAYLGYAKGDFPASEQACKDVLALPMFPELSYEQHKRVVLSCASFLRAGLRLAA